MIENIRGAKHSETKATLGPLFTSELCEKMPFLHWLHGLKGRCWKSSQSRCRFVFLSCRSSSAPNVISWSDVRICRAVKGCLRLLDFLARKLHEFAAATATCLPIRKSGILNWTIKPRASTVVASLYQEVVEGSDATYVMRMPARRDTRTWLQPWRTRCQRSGTSRVGI